MIVLYKEANDVSDKKEKLLLVAEKLFYKHGFHAIGLKRIISEANLAIMTLYNHFDSKNDLIMEILKRREQRYMNYLKKENNASFLSLAKGHAAWLVENDQHGCMFLRAKEEFGNDPAHPIVQFVNKHKQMMIEHVQTLDSSITRQQAMQFTLLLEGSTALAEIESSEIVGKQFIDMTTQLFII